MIAYKLKPNKLIFVKLIFTKIILILFEILRKWKRKLLRLEINSKNTILHEFWHENMISIKQKWSGHFRTLRTISHI